MDGNYGSTMAQRIAAADTIILLNFPRTLCLFRVVKRSIHYRGQTRPDLHEGCPEKLADWAFLRWIWAYPRRSLPTVLELLRAHENSKTIIVLRSPSEVERFLATDLLS
jgi:adenylate kinase family enzyme